MHSNDIIEGKRILIVDDEKDVLDLLCELLSMCKIDSARSFEEAKRLLEENEYDVAILDIMGVNGFELLNIATSRNIPALMLTAHALSEENLKRSAEEGAHYFAPKDAMNKIHVFVADIVEARKQKKNIWVRWFERLGGYYDKRFTGPNWREKHRKFWEEKLKEPEGV
jgi:DNA-binding NtrC family response regulator